MQYFGVPTCPYCKKRVNLIRTWSLKRQGEYQCPRCGGISNIFLSPLIYVFALLAVFAGGAVYFFHKFVLDDITLSTALQVLIPFAVFFLLSLFLVYLAKPVIKKVSRAELEQKKRGKSSFENRRMPSANAAGQTGRVFYDSDEYLPQTDYRTGPLPLPVGDEDIKIHTPAPRQPAAEEELQRTSVIDVQPVRGAPQARDYDTSRIPANRPVREEPARRAENTAARRRSAPQGERPLQGPSETPVRIRQEPVPQRRAPEVEYQRPGRIQTPPTAEARETSRVVSSVEIPSVGDDFFAKYDDPDYIERRLQQLKDERGTDL